MHSQIDQKSQDWTLINRSINLSYIKHIICHYLITKR